MSKLIISQDVLDNLALWTALDPELIRDELNNTERIKRMNGLLNIKGILLSEEISRRILHKMLVYTPKKYRYVITDSVKKIRQLIRKELIEIPHCIFVEEYFKLVKRFNAVPLSWNGFKGCVCLTHDVDSEECYNFVEKTFVLEKRFGIRSTYNFLANWGYRLERNLLKTISDSKFEIGLHGWTHDIALGCRSRERIRKELSMALDLLGVPVKGFRAPAFSVTDRLLEVVAELGIKYDSSKKTISCYGQAVETPYPYRYPGIDIWEIPLTVQDDRLFRDLHLSCEEGLGVVKELIARTIQVGGVAVINTHPRLVKLRLRFYEDLISWLVEEKGVLIATMSEVIDIMEKREKEIKGCLLAAK